MTLRDEIQNIAFFFILGGIGTIVFAFIASGDGAERLYVGLGGAAAIVVGAGIIALTVKKKR